VIKKLFYTAVQVAYDLFLKLNPRKLAAHAVITDEQGRVLILHSRYGGVWALPGGGLDRRENLDAAVIRECREELGVTVAIDGMTGMYYHANISAYVAIFRCRILEGEIRLSHEHNQYRWGEIESLPERLRKVATDALEWDGQTLLHTFY
jgi:8-oxo-dGTP pyrophosphatase MutT (NUDIX family)